MSADPVTVSFVDTKILVYALAADDAKRSPVAQRLVRELMAAQAFQTSTQVLQELYVAFDPESPNAIDRGTGASLPGSDCRLARGCARLRRGAGRDRAFGE